MITEQRIAYTLHLHQEDTRIDASLALGFECWFCLLEGYLNLHLLLRSFKGRFALFEKILYIWGWK